MKERYKPILDTKEVTIYQKRDKTLIISPKEITFQTNDKILKRKKEDEYESNRTSKIISRNL